MRRFFSLVFLCCLALSAYGQIGLSPQSNAPGVRIRGRNPAELAAGEKSLLAGYCHLDFEGARLDPTGWKRMQPYTSLRESPDFQQVLIVSRYDILPSEEHPGVVLVNYRVTGVFDLNEGYSPMNSTIPAQFRTQEEDGSLIISGMSSPLPRVSLQAAIKWMNSRVADKSTPEALRAHMVEALRKLGQKLPEPVSAAN
ncbi:MAG: hypothetical protein P4M01_08770 [Acidobacteriota bacterium]|nr:hypothetical protein [Acidobacteriota bacterium]